MGRLLLVLWDPLRTTTPLRANGFGWEGRVPKQDNRRPLQGQQALFTECNSKNSLLPLVS